MATIYHATSPLSGTTEFDEMQTAVNNYWGDPQEEKIFPIPFWKVLQLLSVSPSEQIALHVNDFNNRALVKAEWEVYNEDLEDLLEAATKPQEYYFVLHESIFDDIRSSIPSIGNPINRLMLWGRLGEATTDSNDFVAFIVAAKGELFDPGAGGGGASTGVRIPSGGDED